MKNLTKFATPQERAAELEDIIRAMYQGKAAKDRVLAALKACAGDLRGQSTARASDALLALQARIANAASTRTASGWNPNALQGIGQDVIGYWATIRQALRKFGAEAEEERRRNESN